MRLAGIILALALWTITVSTADARIRFEGHFLIKAKSGTCNDYDPVGNRGNVHFQPVIAGEPNQTSRARFVLYEDLHAKGYALKTNGNFTTSFKAVDTIYTSDGFGPDDSVANVFVRFTTQPAITNTTNFISVVAQVQNFDFMPGCTVNVHMTLLKRLQN